MYNCFKVHQTQLFSLVAILFFYAIFLCASPAIATTDTASPAFPAATDDTEEAAPAPLNMNDIKSLWDDEHSSDSSRPGADGPPAKSPHKTRQEMQDWVVETVTDVLTLDRPRIDRMESEIKPFFTSNAYDQYYKFIEESNILSLVYHGQNTSLSTLISEAPALVFADTITFDNLPEDNPYHEGVYKWRYEVPVILNLVRGHLTDYTEGSGDQRSLTPTLCITVSRVMPAVTDMGVVIDSWQNGRCPATAARSTIQ